MDKSIGPDAAALLRKIAEDHELMTAAHLAIENKLIDLRDSGIMIGVHANGLVVRGKDGSASEVIRMGTRMGIVMALKAIADHIEAPQEWVRTTPNG